MLEFLFNSTLAIMKIGNETKNRKQLLEKMLELEEQQYEMFNMFINEVRALQHGPFHVGLTYLEDAKKPHRTLKESNEILKQARKEFVKTLGNIQGKKQKTAFDVYSIGFIQSYISITWLMLEKSYDAIDWMKKSVESLNTAQKHFELDIRSLNAEILTIERESWEYQKKIKDSFVGTTFDFFFGNLPLEEKKQRLPEYRSLVTQYSNAIGKTESYRDEMAELLKQMKQEVEGKEQQKFEAIQKLQYMKDNIIDIAKDKKISELAKKLPKLKGIGKGE